MKTILSSLIIIILLPILSFAQYTQQGKIEYERNVNIYAQLADFGNDDSWMDRMKAELPKFKKSYFDLSFNADKTIYKPGRKTDDKPNVFADGAAFDNTVLTDFKTQQITAIKTVFEKKFLVKDTMRKVQWKIMDEIRTIENFKCRKAVCKVFDSVYVVAFYTDDITTSGGPEMFSGLPGMILELAIPRLHTTWTANKIEFTPPTADDLTIANKGKQVTEKELYETLKGSFAEWGKLANREMWWSLL